MQPLVAMSSTSPPRLMLMALLLLVVQQRSTRANAMDPWPTINTSPQYSQVPKSNVDMSSSANTRGRNSSSSSSQMKHTSSCHCKFFVWNVLSYLKYKETLYQTRQNTIEGRGGKKFIRMQPGSMLEKWYPQLKSGLLKPDGCVLCGFSYKEHLEYWWRCRRRQGGVASFDRYINNASKRLEQDAKKKSRATSEDERFAFHQQYLDEVKARSKQTKQKATARKGDSMTEWRDSYNIPAFNPLADGKPKRLMTVLMLSFARTASLLRLDDLMFLSRVESIRLEEKK